MCSDRRRRTAFGLAAAAGLALGLALPGEVRASELDLRTRGAAGALNGAWFEQVDPQPTGTGYIDPFVRIQARGSEQGYNTDGRPVQYDEKEPANYTRSILLGDVGTVERDGVAYRVFLLDINETDGRRSLLALDELELYLGSAGDFTHFDPVQHAFVDPGATSRLVYDLDAGPDGDSTIRLDYALNHGSGSGDMLAYIPDALFAPAGGTPYLYLYSKFGVPDPSEAGFEEWAALKPSVRVPEPATLTLLALGGLVLALRARRAGG